MSVTVCGICRKPVMDDNGPIGDVVDNYIYDFDGSLDYIELYHRQCALRKGYKIKNDTVVRESQQVGEYPQVNEALPEPLEDEVRRVQGRFQVVDRKGKPFGEPHASYTQAQRADQAAQKVYYDKKRIREDVKRVPFRYEVKRLSGSLDFVVWDTHTKRKVGGAYKSKYYDGDDMFARAAAQGAASRMNREWADEQKPPVQMREGIEKARHFQRNMAQNNRDWGGYIGALIDAWQDYKGLDDVPLRGQGYDVSSLGTAKALKADTRLKLNVTEGPIKRKFGNTIIEVAPVGQKRGK